MKKFLIISTFLLSFTVHAYSKTLWQSTTTGMTVNQVQKLFSDADRISPIAIQTLGSGAKSLLELKSYKIGINYYKATFYFKDNGLNQVTLTLLDGQYALGAYKSLTDAFRIKYGAEVINDEGHYLWEKRWISREKSNVTMLLIDKMLLVIYNEGNDLDLDKL
ncbi:hypothetical protein [Acinetobacter sp. HY1485]|uniref:hypothetical protein n=1 Tax=Acinetobacter sp. HY1485 TaxID=2970918 RepID=UPI0022B950A9|nr:hypothetical protein [Acinetobacter sp. HY1485]